MRYFTVEIPEPVWNRFCIWCNYRAIPTDMGEDEWYSEFECFMDGFIFGLMTHPVTGQPFVDMYKKEFSENA